MERRAATPEACLCELRHRGVSRTCTGTEVSHAPAHRDRGVSRTCGQVMAGECEGVVMFADAWLIQQGQSTHNPCCDMHRLGDVIYSSSAGWAMSTDAGVRCTSCLLILCDVLFIVIVRRLWEPTQASDARL